MIRKQASVRCALIALCIILASFVSGHTGTAAAQEVVTDQLAPEMFTTILPGPEGGEAFEPSIAINPADSKRIIVAAMYGRPFAAGGRNIWVWDTNDSGRSWAGGRMRPPKMAYKKKSFAADVVVGFAGDGASLVTSMGGNQNPGDGGSGGIFVSRRAPGQGQFAEPVEVMHNITVSRAGLSVDDKPWMVVDLTNDNAGLGTVYVTASVLGYHPHRPGDTRLAAFTESPLFLSVSKDGGQTFSRPKWLADDAFAGFLIVRKTGSLDISYGHDGGIFHLTSLDGGASFDPPVRIAAKERDVELDIPTMAARPNGDLMACWQRTQTEGAAQLRCALKRAGNSWEELAQPTVSLQPSQKPAYPMLVGTADGWYLLLYLIDTAKTEVAIFRSSGTTTFSTLAKLASIPGLGAKQYCESRACRLGHRDPAHDGEFAVGDYVGLASVGGRLAAAYVLPRSHDATRIGPAAVYVSVLDGHF